MNKLNRAKIGAILLALAALVHFSSCSSSTKPEKSQRDKLARITQLSFSYNEHSNKWKTHVARIVEIARIDSAFRVGDTLDLDNGQTVVVRSWCK